MAAGTDEDVVFRHQLRTLATAYTPDWLCELIPGLSLAALHKFLSGASQTPKADRQAVDILYAVTRLGDLEPSEAYLTKVRKARRYAERARASEIAWRDAG